MPEGTEIPSIRVWVVVVIDGIREPLALRRGDKNPI